ncbi:UDP-glucose/GDP-mannose dehydrogenase family protein [Mycobacterium sp. PS03-16]|uniref:UDP-glucose dehydrogenase family protein n=1 Tax=Mycobacterium sp. PS03-16 TaxID=2559611 RepID=UPI001073D0B4|nr:UDP-glucose/GDP-mannose dehydrogenase family protein [Mycobacterium sp. PS03-16]TFV58631.1 UDP-glucose/GDP-mannose dehydrogenase family protein [Mycobacterium sp. PS03-16]
MTALRTGVIGAGYVGLTSAVCLADRGHDTVCVDVDAERVRTLSGGTVTIDEPDLPDLLERGVATGTLRFTTDYAELADRDVVFICVSTPSGPDGSADLRAVDASVEALTEVLRAGAVVVVKSTVPVGTTRQIAERLRSKDIRVVSNPEFLRESHAVHDFRHPDRIVVGADDPAAADTVAQLYPPAPVLRMTPESAEVAKYASNAFLAVKISYTNSLARLCAHTGADITDVTRSMGADPRIGPHFLQPGPGWGGSCLPKDTAALLHVGARHGVTLSEVESARATNAAQPAHIADTVARAIAVPLTQARVTVLGLTFKAGTTDVRDSPALTVCAEFAGRGAQVVAHDPRLAGIDPAALRRAAVTAVDDPYLACKEADAVVVVTEWPEFRALDWAAIAEQSPGAVVVDTRNLLDAAAVRDAGLTHLANGIAGGY